MGTDNCDANTKHFTSLPPPPHHYYQFITVTASDVGLVNMSGRPTGVGGKESEWRPSQQPVRETYWSWREGVPVETVSTS